MSKKKTPHTLEEREELADFLTLLDQRGSAHFIGWVMSMLTTSPDITLAELVSDFREDRTRRILEAAGLPSEPVVMPPPASFDERQAIREKKIA